MCSQKNIKNIELDFEIVCGRNNVIVIIEWVRRTRFAVVYLEWITSLYEWEKTNSDT